MFKRNLISFLLFLLAGYSFSQTSDLLISEYGEGSSGNSKYIEIYNGTGSIVNLANYRLCMISNGGAWCESNYAFSTANIANGATLVVANNGTDVPGADEYSTSISWNGDDAVSLQKFSGTWNLLDVVGMDGPDPGTGWAVAGTTNATKDHVLTRKTSICDPNTNWTSSRGTTIANSEWVVTNYTTGSANAGHSVACVVCTPDPEPTSHATNLTFPNTTCNSIDLNWNAGNGNNRIVIASNSPIIGTPTDQITYSANTIFGSGSTISAGEFVVYNGNGTSVSVSGLSNATTYYFAIFEYNGTIPNCEENYYSTGFLTGNETTTLASEPTTNASALLFPDTTCSSIDLSWTTGNGTNAVVVASTSPIVGTPTDQTAYTANTIFGSGSTIAAGEFVIYNNSGTSTTITGLAASTTYYFSIFEYNGTTANCEENYLTSSTLTGIFATPSCPVSTDPEITGILVDACGGTEGTDEFFTFTNGNSSLSLDDLKADFPNGESYCNLTCGTKTWVTNSTYVGQLNTTAGCVGLFLEADPIPAGAKTIVFTGSSPTYNFDFTGLCGTGPYYAVFANNTNGSGRFGNYDSDCSEFRTLTVHFGGGYSDDVTYQRCALSDVDGDYVSFDAAGNPTYKNDGCTPTAILPVSLLSLYGKSSNSKNTIFWVTSSEINNDYFTLEKSKDGRYFNAITNINGAGNSNYQINYNYTDIEPYPGINYYRLKQTDFNGDYSYSNTIALNANIIKHNVWHYNNKLTIQPKTEVNQNSKLSIYNSIGKLVYIQNINGAIEINTSQFVKGIYLVKIEDNSNVLIKKIKF